MSTIILYNTEGRSYEVEQSASLYPVQKAFVHDVAMDTTTTGSNAKPKLHCFLLVN
jgi:hypothetical protein